MHYLKVRNFEMEKNIIVITTLRINWKKYFRWLIGIGLGMTIAFVGFVASLSLWPSFGAHGADLFRATFGDKAATSLESGIYGTEDAIRQWAYHFGWISSNLPAGPSVVGGTVSTATVLPPAPGTTPTFTITPTKSELPAVTSVLSSNSLKSPTSPSSAWSPGALVPLKMVQQEGSWSPYIKNSASQEVAALTSFRPDPKRPYAVAAVVAFDLDHTQLHFVLGTTEPYSPNSLPRSGAIPKNDRGPGVLLAMFNGGFKARHGQFGAMSNGLVAIPARDGLATLAINTKGKIQIGEWGVDIKTSPDWVAWRQNGPLIIQNGAITPKVYHPLPTDWGDSLGGTTPVWRSGIGLSADGKTLFYACGPSLTIEALANSLLAVGSVNAMQLDINNYWVLFDAVHNNGTKLILTPLFPNQMNDNIDRYLWHYERDYFYVTNKP